MAAHTYKLTARVVIPDFAAERRYVVTEAEYANRQRKSRHTWWWVVVSFLFLNVVKRADWRQYTQDLERYKRQLSRHEEEIGDGLMPLSILVANTSEKPDANVKIRVMVENGTIRTKLKAPERPKRIDGAPDFVPGERRLRMPVLSTFLRRGVRIEDHGVEAEFTTLGARDSASLVIPTLYVVTTERTRINYVIDSRNLPEEERGKVDLTG